MLEIKLLIHWWLTPKFPEAHIKKVLAYEPEGWLNFYNDRLRTWFIHPIKRRIARYYLIILQKFFGLKVIAVTGSAGKTTAKEMLALVLSQKGKTIASYANIDPVYNIPTTILKCRPSTKFLVLEMGVEYPNEMDFYLWLAKPVIGIITTIYWTHTEFLKDLKNVVKEKGKLIKFLPREGFAILNKDDNHVNVLAEKTNAKVIWVGLNKNTDVRAKNVRITKNFKTQFELITNSGNIDIKLNLLGQQFVPLALASASVGLELGLKLEAIKTALQKLEPIPHRMIPIKIKNGTIIIDDTYNANPLAVIEALKVLSEVAGDKRKILVLGDMKELGIYEERGHKQVADAAVKMGVDKIFTLGESTEYTVKAALKQGLTKDDVFNTDEKNELVKKLKKTIKPHDVILIKGSRSIGLESVVEEIVHFSLKN